MWIPLSKSHLCLSDVSDLLQLPPMACTPNQDIQMGPFRQYLCCTIFLCPTDFLVCSLTDLIDFLKGFLRRVRHIRHMIDDFKTDIFFIIIANCRWLLAWPLVCVSFAPDALSPSARTSLPLYHHLLLILVFVTLYQSFVESGDDFACFRVLGMLSVEFCDVSFHDGHAGLVCTGFISPPDHLLFGEIAAFVHSCYCCCYHLCCGCCYASQVWLLLEVLDLLEVCDDVLACVLFPRISLSRESSPLIGIHLDAHVWA